MGARLRRGACSRWYDPVEELGVAVAIAAAAGAAWARPEAAVAVAGPIWMTVDMALASGGGGGGFLVSSQCGNTVREGPPPLDPEIGGKDGWRAGTRESPSLVGERDDRAAFKAFTSIIAQTHEDGVERRGR